MNSYIIDNQINLSRLASQVGHDHDLVTEALVELGIQHPDAVEFASFVCDDYILRDHDISPCLATYLHSRIAGMCVPKCPKCSSEELLPTGACIACFEEQVATENQA